MRQLPLLDLISRRARTVILIFLLLPSMSVSTRPHGSSLQDVVGHFLAETSARADDFKSLGDQIGGQQVEDLAITCNYVDRINAVMGVLRKVAAVQSALTSGPLAIIAEAESIPQMCQLAMAILSAKNLDGVLRAGRMANRMYVKSDTAMFDFIEDSVDLAVSLDEFGKSKDSNIDKALNAGMYAKVLNYAFDYTPLEKASTRAKESAAVSSRQTQLIADMKLNNTCLALSTSAKEEAAKKAEARKGFVDLPNGLDMKEEEAKRLFGRQEKATATLNGAGVERMKILGASLMTMIQRVETRGADALEVSGEIIRRLIDAEQPYPAVGYNFAWVTTKLKKTDGDITQEENDFCNKAAKDPTDAAGQKDSETERKRKCQEIKDRVDMRRAFYASSRAGVVDDPCDEAGKSIYKLELFEARNITSLADPNFDPRVVAETVRVCGAGSFSQVPIDRLVAGRERSGNLKEPNLYSDEDAAARDKELIRQSQDSCIEGASTRALKRFNSIKSFGPSADNALEADWKSQVGCQSMTREELTRQKKDGGLVRYQQFSQDFSTAGDWEDYYNQKLNEFIKLKFKGFADTSVARSLRGVKKIDNALAPDDTSFGGGNKWSSGEASWNNPTDNVRRMRGEMGLVSLCELKSRLLRDYPDKKDIINGDNGATPRQLLELIQQCRNEREGTIDDYQDIFSTYLQALYDEKEALARARADLFEIDVLFGAYVGATGVRKAVECNSVRSTQLNTQLANSIMGSVAGTVLDLYKLELQRDLERSDQDRAIDETNQKLQREMRERVKERQRGSTVIEIKKDPSTSTMYPAGEITKKAQESVDPKYGPKAFKGARK